MKYDKNKYVLNISYVLKKKWIGWLLWLFLAFIGAHSFYLKRIKTGLFYIVTTVIMLFTGHLYDYVGTNEPITLTGIIGCTVSLAVVIVFLMDAIKMNSRIDCYNEEILRDL